MSTVTIEETQPEGAASIYQEFWGEYQVLEQSKTRMTLVSEDGLKVILKGQGFPTDGSVGGRAIVDTMVYKDADNAIWATVTDVDLKLSLLGKELNAASFYYRATIGNDKAIGSSGDDILFSFDGKDVMKGRGGDDILNAGVGKDTVTGGDGSDQFVIGATRGNDIITDFEAVGGAGVQDYLYVDGSGDFKKVRDGDDVIIDFKNGADITLKNVDFNDVGLDDFIFSA